MAKRSNTKRLAKALKSTKSRAKEFVHEVNHILHKQAQPAVPLIKIIEILNSATPAYRTPEWVARQIPYDFCDPITVATTCKTVDVMPTPDLIAKQMFLPFMFAEIQDSNVQHLPTEVQSEDIASPVEIAVVARILESLLGKQLDQVTYLDIEKAMREANLDPFQAEEQYIWLIERLEERQILVVDQVLSTAPIVDVEAEYAAITLEVHQILAEIWDNYKNGDILLTAEKEQQLLEVFRDGKRAETRIETEEIYREQFYQRANDGKEALQMLLHCNRKLVASIALKFSHNVQHLEFEDLLQEGMLGLVKAIKHFNLESNVRLSTYATWWIRQAISRAIADQDRLIRLPVYRHDAMVNYKKVFEKLNETLLQPPTELEIAKELQLLSPEVLNQIQTNNTSIGRLDESIRQQVDRAVQYVTMLAKLATLHPVSLDLPTGEGIERVLGDFIEDDRFLLPEDAAYQAILRDTLGTMLKDLSNREQTILCRRFGLRGGEPETLEEIAQDYHVTRERIRQIETKALNKLKHPRCIEKLKDFYFF